MPTKRNARTRRHKNGKIDRKEFTRQVGEVVAMLPYLMQQSRHNSTAGFFWYIDPIEQQNPVAWRFVKDLFTLTGEEMAAAWKPLIDQQRVWAMKRIPWA